MAQRLILNDRLRGAVARLLADRPCPACGDLLEDHEWFDVQGAGTPDAHVTRCDRGAPAAPAQRRPHAAS